MRATLTYGSACFRAIPPTTGLFSFSRTSTSFTHWYPTRVTGCALLPPPLTAAIQLSSPPGLCASFSTYRDVDGYVPTFALSHHASARSSFVSLDPNPPCALLRSGGLAIAFNGLFLTHHHRATVTRIKRSTNTTTTTHFFSITTPPSVLARRLQHARRPELSTVA
ncbi:hypothetical protein MSAN_02415100 [Mycena sanguinolenta]|uniref:Uncharacterized protein n=1 Tax=Mycena sanguinolenta TaxID=230812 RepID=A0A8H6X3L1_9AGAR|nr:hypothetical protein MSAN_02415100 [Mycena sanguinolenta]